VRLIELDDYDFEVVMEKENLDAVIMPVVVMRVRG
jgi:hypothetical protein